MTLKKIQQILLGLLPLALALLGTTGCASGEYAHTITGETEIAQLAINAWIDHGNSFPQSCYLEMGKAQIHFSTPDEWECSSDPKTTDGCHMRKGNSKEGTGYSLILLRDTMSPLQANTALAHEYMHLLSHCAYGNHDKEHSRDSAWRGASIEVVNDLIQQDLRYRRGETEKLIEL